MSASLTNRRKTIQQVNEQTTAKISTMTGSVENNLMAVPYEEQHKPIDDHDDG
jgi:hypothetical protein